MTDLLMEFNSSLPDVSAFWIG